MQTSYSKKSFLFEDQWRSVFKVLWIALLPTATIVRVLSLPFDYAELSSVCAGGQCSNPSLSLKNLADLQALNLSANFFATYFLMLAIISSLVWFAVGVVILRRRPDERAAHFAALTIVLFGLNFNADIAIMPGLLQVGVGFFESLASVSMLVFIFIFPDGRFVPRWLAWPLLAAILVQISADLPPRFYPEILSNDTLVIVRDQYFLAVSVLWLLAQVYRYRYVSTTVQQLQTRWVLVGIAVPLFAISAIEVTQMLAPALDPDQNTFFNFVGNSLWYLSLLTIPISLGFAILRFKLWDIDLIINRALVYGLLTVSVAGGYALVVGGFGLLFQSQNNLLVSILVTGFIAVIFHPLRERLQRAINRLMYGERDEPYRVLIRLGQQLETAVAPSAAMPLTVKMVGTALKLPYVAIILNQEDTPHLVAAHGPPQPNTTHFPLVYAGETIGELLVAARTPREGLTGADQRLLNDLARQIGITAHAALLAIELERARLRIVATSDETRRRLGNDLHDGVGHQLTGLARQTERAASLLEHDPEKAQSILSEVTHQLNAAITQVRQLAYQLHPPELELLGLVGALRERILTWHALAIRLDAPETMPPLPGALETAAYYIALEALTNVEKHAGARSCYIRMAYVPAASISQPAMLELDVSDDGQGLSTANNHGLGLLSMQARAAEVGGTCSIQSNPLQGTHIRVRLPCPTLGE